MFQPAREGKASSSSTTSSPFSTLPPPRNTTNNLDDISPARALARYPDMGRNLYTEVSLARCDPFVSFFSSLALGNRRRSPTSVQYRSAYIETALARDRTGAPRLMDFAGGRTANILGIADRFIIHEGFENARFSYAGLYSRKLAECMRASLARRHAVVSGDARTWGLWKSLERDEGAVYSGCSYSVSIPLL